MTDPIATLIAAAKNAVRVYNGDTTHHEERVAIDALAQAIAVAEARPSPTQCRPACTMATRLAGDGCDVCNPALAADLARPEPEPDDACDFYEQLPKGPTHGRFSASDRAELGDLKRKAFEAARPEPAAEPSEADELIRIARDGAEAGYNSAALLATIDALKALAREVRRG